MSKQANVKMKRAQVGGTVPAAQQATPPETPVFVPAAGPREAPQVMVLIDPDNMSNAEVRAYYEAKLRGKPVSDMTDAEMKIATLYGEMAKAMRDEAELTGQQAEIEQVRRKAKVQVERQGTAAYLQTVFAANVRALHQQDRVRPLRIAVTHGDDTLEIDETMVAATFLNIHGQKAKQYQKVVQDLLQIIQDTAQQEANRVAMPDGKDYRTHITDLSWVDVRDKKAATNQQKTP